MSCAGRWRKLLRFEGMGLRGRRFNSLILVMTLTYFQVTVLGEALEKPYLQHCVSRPNELSRGNTRRSHCGLG